jgi:hypothetical protein
MGSLLGQKYPSFRLMHLFLELYRKNLMSLLRTISVFFSSYSLYAFVKQLNAFSNYLLSKFLLSDVLGTFSEDFYGSMVDASVEKILGKYLSLLFLLFLAKLNG